jgi:hypothetical protein
VRPASRSSAGGFLKMLDLLYVATALLFFALCRALTKACEKL